MTTPPPAQELHAAAAAEPTATLLSQSIELKLTGQPDTRYKYDTGRVRPERAVLYYLTGHVNAHLFGSWVSEDSELTNDPVDQLYRGSDEDWPDWLSKLAIDWRPRTVLAGGPSDTCRCYPDPADHEPGRPCALCPTCDGDGFHQTGCQAGIPEGAASCPGPCCS